MKKKYIQILCLSLSISIVSIAQGMDWSNTPDQESCFFPDHFDFLPNPQNSWDFQDSVNQNMIPSTVDMPETLNSTSNISEPSQPTSDIPSDNFNFFPESENPNDIDFDALVDLPMPPLLPLFENFNTPLFAENNTTPLDIMNNIQPSPQSFDTSQQPSIQKNKNTTNKPSSKRRRLVSGDAFKCTEEIIQQYIKKNPLLLQHVRDAASVKSCSKTGFVNSTSLRTHVLEQHFLFKRKEKIPQLTWDFQDSVNQNMIPSTVDMPETLNSTNNISEPSQPTSDIPSDNFNFFPESENPNDIDFDALVDLPMPPLLPLFENFSTPLFAENNTTPLDIMNNIQPSPQSFDTSQQPSIQKKKNTKNKNSSKRRRLVSGPAFKCTEEIIQQYIKKNPLLLQHVGNAASVKSCSKTGFVNRTSLRTHVREQHFLFKRREKIPQLTRETTPRLTNGNGFPCTTTTIQEYINERPELLLQHGESIKGIQGCLKKGFASRASLKKHIRSQHLGLRKRKKPATSESPAMSHPTVTTNVSENTGPLPLSQASPHN